MSYSHDHCPNCGEHRTIVGTVVATGPTTWVCSRCKKAASLINKGNVAVIACPECNGIRDVALPCAACRGYGSVRIAEADLPLYQPRSRRSLVEG